MSTSQVLGLQMYTTVPSFLDRQISAVLLDTEAGLTWREDRAGMGCKGQAAVLGGGVDEPG